MKVKYGLSVLGTPCGRASPAASGLLADFAASLLQALLLSTYCLGCAATAVFYVRASARLGEPFRALLAGGLRRLFHLSPEFRDEFVRHPRQRKQRHPEDNGQDPVARPLAAFFPLPFYIVGLAGEIAGPGRRSSPNTSGDYVFLFSRAVVNGLVVTTITNALVLIVGIIQRHLFGCRSTAGVKPLKG